MEMCNNVNKITVTFFDNLLHHCWIKALILFKANKQRNKNKLYSLLNVSYYIFKLKCIFFSLRMDQKYCWYIYIFINAL